MEKRDKDGLITIEQLIAKTTDEALLSEDWNAILHVCDIVNNRPQLGKEIVKETRRRLKNATPNAQYLACVLLEAIVKNCPGVVSKVGGKKGQETVLDTLTSKKTLPRVKDKLVSMIQEFAVSYPRQVPENKDLLFESTFASARKAGVVFPSELPSYVGAPPPSSSSSSSSTNSGDKRRSISKRPSQTNTAAPSPPPVAPAEEAPFGEVVYKNPLFGKRVKLVPESTERLRQKKLTMLPSVDDGPSRKGTASSLALSEDDVSLVRKPRGSSPAWKTDGLEDLPKIEDTPPPVLKVCMPNEEFVSIKFDESIPLHQLRDAVCKKRNLEPPEAFVFVHYNQPLPKQGLSDELLLGGLGVERLRLVYKSKLAEAEGPASADDSAHLPKPLTGSRSSTKPAAVALEAKRNSRPPSQEDLSKLQALIAGELAQQSSSSAKPASPPHGGKQQLPANAPLAEKVGMDPLWQ
eukprot:TRINITY_DN3852_c0_g1_i1.p1 TRINITY_DN3852_c0_g1~~TRINITY_DN3852_c0_g1_i1.p1  ORF type:complete len:464 (-),score=164.33 TRINITY_DN3852_c0_g1_i1:1315-2706(-)